MSFYARPMEQPLYFYRQHCAQRKPPVFNLLRGRFWGFFAPQGLHVAPMGVKFGTEEGPSV